MKRSVVILPNKGLLLFIVYVFKLLTFFGLIFWVIFIDICGTNKSDFGTDTPALEQHKIFLEHNFCSPVTKDGDNLEEIINYRIDSIEEYYGRIKKVGKKRKVARWLTRKKRIGECNNGKSI